MKWKVGDEVVFVNGAYVDFLGSGPFIITKIEMEGTDDARYWFKAVLANGYEKKILHKKTENFSEMYKTR